MQAQLIVYLQMLYTNIFKDVPVWLFVFLALIVAFFEIKLIIRLFEKLKQQQIARIALEKEKIVKDTSPIFSQLVSLNARYKFHEISSETYFTTYAKSLNEYRRLTFEKCLDDNIEYDSRFYKGIIEKAKANSDLFKKYMLEVNLLLSGNRLHDTFTPSFDSEEYYEIEDRVLRQTFLNPVINPKVIWFISYSSPKGYSTQSQNTVFSLNDIITHMKIVEENKVKKNSEKSRRQAERSKMTDSLRYEIMRRDGFKCVLCGATADDGAKLVIDHIVPVAKGGKTVTENLRTLCSVCNSGKSDKYDPNGPN